MNSNSVLERHADLYFTDGDVVLAVKQTPKADEEPPKYSLFRVHKFLLKHHSATFTNFFADANATPVEVYDGVPLAEMHGDKAEDFALLLSYLYNPSSLVFRRRDPNTPLIVSGVIRLADKYLIEPLHRCLVQQVCDDWPATLHEYDVQQAEIYALQNPIDHPTYGFTPDGRIRRLTDVIPEPASAIQFAQEFGCRQVLPAAFYRLSFIPVERDWSTDSYRELAARWFILDQGSSAFMCGKCVGAWGMDEDDVAAHPCYQFIERLIEIVWDEPPSPTHPDPLRLLARCADYDKIPQLSREHFPQGLCTYCAAVLPKELHRARKKMWERLRTAFKLE